MRLILLDLGRRRTDTYLVSTTANLQIIRRENGEGTLTAARAAKG